MEEVFVYGTLRTGEYNNSVMTYDGGKTHLLGEGITMRSFCLGGSGFPKAYLEPADTHLRAKTFQHHLLGRVKGEVWEADQKAMDNMDHLEGYPRFYNRVKISVRLIDGTTRFPWMYVIADSKLPLEGLYPTNKKGLHDWPREVVV